MNWEAIGAVGELVGAIGVIVSLVYLASQIRTQNRESRLAGITEMTTHWNEFLSSFVEHEYFSEIWVRGLRDFSCLSQAETVQFSSHSGRFMRLVSSLRDQHEQGRLDEPTWEGMRRTLEDLCRYPGFRAWWPTRSHWHSNDFIAFVEPYMSSTAPPRMYGEERDGHPVSFPPRNPA